MKKKIIIMFIILNSIILLNECMPISWTHTGLFTNLYDGKKTGLDSLIHLNGYYQSIKFNGSSNGNCMFYSDGTFVDNFLVENPILEFNDAITNWGHYFIVGDTIKAQTLSFNGEMYFSYFTTSKAWVYDRWFKIISKDTLLDIYYHFYDDSSAKWEYLNTKTVFHPLNSRPDSTCWLKEKSWAWKDGKLIK